MGKKKKCPYCNDFGWKECEECNGKGYIKTVDPMSFSLYGKPTFQSINCDRCNGTGKIPCLHCGGIGWY